MQYNISDRSYMRGKVHNNMYLVFITISNTHHISASAIEKNAILVRQNWYQIP